MLQAAVPGGTRPLRTATRGASTAPRCPHCHSTVDVCGCSVQTRKRRNDVDEDAQALPKKKRTRKTASPSTPVDTGAAASSGQDIVVGARAEHDAAAATEQAPPSADAPPDPQPDGGAHLQAHPATPLEASVDPSLLGVAADVRASSAAEEDVGGERTPPPAPAAAAALAPAPAVPAQQQQPPPAKKVRRGGRPAIFGTMTAKERREIFTDQEKTDKFLRDSKQFDYIEDTTARHRFIRDKLHSLQSLVAQFGRRTGFPTVLAIAAPEHALKPPKKTMAPTHMYLSPALRKPDDEPLWFDLGLWLLKGFFKRAKRARAAKLTASEKMAKAMQREVRKRLAVEEELKEVQALLKSGDVAGATALLEARSEAEAAGAVEGGVEGGEAASSAEADGASMSSSDEGSLEDGSGSDDESDDDEEEDEDFDDEDAAE